jgi:hypothetical protein
LLANHFRYHTNGYAVHSRRCVQFSDFLQYKDHIIASQFADQNEATDSVLADVVSATVKTPGSASLLPAMSGGADAISRAFASFAAGSSTAGVPEAYAWIKQPLEKIRHLVARVGEGCGHDAVADLLPTFSGTGYELH